MNKALILDRDGVINRNFGHVHKINNFIFRKGIFELVHYFQKRNFLIIVVTNQAGISKGLYSIHEFNLLNTWMINEFKSRGITIKHVYFCPHQDSDNCICRKPKPGMILNAIKDFSLDPTNCLFIGDKETDKIASISSGIGFFLNLSEFKTIAKLFSYLVRIYK